MLGARIDRHFIRGTLTQWGRDPWALGAYATAQPGYTDHRALLSKPFDDKLFVAGEACAGEMATTCGGAFLNGQAVAGDVASVVR